MNSFKIGERDVSVQIPPLVIAEIGINHEGSIEKAFRMVDDAVNAGCECVKFQTHVIDDEMVPNSVIPGNAEESIWEIMERCALSAEEEARLKVYSESKGSIFMSTPFSRAAAEQLEKLDVPAFKIGSGECNNYPLIEHIASYGKPIILSTGMNDLPAIDRSVAILKKHKVPFVLMQCTSMYPTPYDKVHLGALSQLQTRYKTDFVGLSDHSIGNYTCFAAVALGACVLEKHFTSDMTWPGPDVPISIDPGKLSDLIIGSRAVHSALSGEKIIHDQEAPTIAFAYASVVIIRPIKAGEKFSMENIWVKRPGTGEILADQFENILGKTSVKNLQMNDQLTWNDIQ
jgi:sialic acid synthase SpsE